jgi:energy-coupling factor transport system permease protein
MLVTWRYRERDTLIQRLDPRARLIFFGCFMLAVLSFWDLRVLAILLVLGLAHVLLARVSWHDTRRAWLFIGTVAILYTLITFLTGRGGFELYTTEHIISRLEAPVMLFGWRPTILVTAERITYALCQFSRIMAITTFALTIPYTINPRHYGIAFRGLGLPDKFAFAMDLAFRFVPTIARDFAITYDAQRARGYELERLRGGLITQIRRLAPLLVPVVIQAIVGGEEIIDAMDLRAFGVGPRTWLPELHYAPRDWVLIGFGVLLLVVSLGLSVAGIGKFWVPPELLRLATG